MPDPTSSLCVRHARIAIKKQWRAYEFLGVGLGFRV